MRTILEYNAELSADLLRYGTILTDITFEAENVRLYTVKDRSNQFWFIRKMNGTVYDCINLSECNSCKRIIYPDRKEE